MDFVIVFKTSKGTYSSFEKAYAHTAIDDDPRSQTYKQKEVPWRVPAMRASNGRYFELAPLELEVK